MLSVNVMQSVTVQVMVTVNVTVIALVPFLACCHGDCHGFVRCDCCVHGAWESVIWILSVIYGVDACKKKQTKLNLNPNSFSLDNYLKKSDKMPPTNLYNLIIKLPWTATTRASAAKPEINGNM